VEPDEERRHNSLAGASELPDGYFLAKWGGRSQLAGAFEPTDDELISFLASRSVKPLERESWIEGHLVGEGAPAEESNQSVPLEVAAAPLNEPARELTDEQLAKVKELRGKSLTAIVHAVFGSSSGSAWYWRAELVSQALKQMDNAVTTSPSHQTPVLGTS